MSDEKTKPELISILDPAQRTIIGEFVEKSDTVLKIKNPVVVNIVPQIDEMTRQPNGQMALQLLPVYFREFLGDKKSPVVFEYPRHQITIVSWDGGFDFRLIGQYQNIFAGTEPQPEKKAAPVLKLFEDT